jgi:leucyl aminopeptidase (aminopeptidase T)
MAAADVVLCPTTHSLTHTKARIDASAAGARIATMPGITREMFEKGAITADYAKVEALTLRITALLDKAETATIRKDGHTLTLFLAGRKGLPSTGVYKRRGESGNLPSGEAYIAPVEDGSSGSMVIDGSMVGVGKLTSPLTVHLADGRLTKIEGAQADKLDILFAQPENGVLCELGIGTNDAAILCGVILEDEKVYGTVHIAFGTNTSFGGTNKAGCHMDGVITKPTLLLDGAPVLVNGEFKS